MAIRVVLNGLARSTMFLARHEHNLTRKVVGHAGTKPVLGRAQAPPHARRAGHNTAWKRWPDGTCCLASMAH
jgi:hypothetical protein